MATFASGAQSTKFDRMGTPEMISKYKETSAKISGVEDRVIAIEKRLNSGDDEFGKLGRQIEALDHNMNTLVTGIETSIMALSDYDKAIDAVLTPFLASRLVRFLNIFGGWYIYHYTTEGVTVVLNIPEHENMGKIPWITRVKRWFRRIFH